jgi:hypothetical protein
MGLALGRRNPARGSGEQAPIGRTRVQHWRAPLGGVTHVADRPEGPQPGRLPAGSRRRSPIQLLGEDDRRVVGALKLHCHHYGLLNRPIDQSDKLCHRLIVAAGEGSALGGWIAIDRVDHADARSFYKEQNEPRTNPTA